MERALVVHDSDENGREIMAEASELAAGVDAELTILALMTPEEYEEVRETLDVVAQEEQTSYGDESVLNAVRREARDDLEASVDDLEFDWEIVGARVGDDENSADRILSIADERDVDHVFLSGRKRSPTGKAVFGDRAQSVILNFDGPVTSLLS